MADTEHGKKAEAKIKEWLDRPDDGYSFDRIPDQMTGFYNVSRNICDFTCYKYPYKYYIESKATEHDRFDFSQLTDTQRDGLLIKSKIAGCYGLVIVLFVEYKRAFIFDIRDIADFIDPTLSLAEQQYFSRSGGKDHKVVSQLKTKSVNVTKEAKWGIPHWEIQTVPNNRKQFLDYVGDLPDFDEELRDL